MRPKLPKSNIVLLCIVRWGLSHVVGALHMLITSRIYLPFKVKWYKDTMLLDPNNNRHMETYGNRHVLILRHVSETDFGNYSCSADNSLGTQRGSIEVSGKCTLSTILEIGFLNPSKK